MELAADLCAALERNSAALLDDADTLTRYGRDMSSVAAGTPLAVVFPRSAADVQAIVRLANRHGLALVPSGGRTGLSGGAVAAAGALVVSLERMNRILAFEAADRCVRCEAGVVIAELQRFARAQGLCYPVEFAASGSAHIGGSIATNAGGINVIRYGMTRQWVQGLQVVTGGGELLELNGMLVKNNTGYDLRQLFIGSEGTLGIITQAVLRLCDPPAPASVMLLALPRLAHATAVLAQCRARLALSAFEFFSDAGLRHVLRQLALETPLASTAAYYLLVEFDAGAGPQAHEQVFADCLQLGLVSDGVLSHSLAQSAALWRLRESLSPVLAPMQPRKFDVAVPVHAVAAFVAALEAGLAERAAELECVLWGHIGDGNLHINLLRAPGMSSAEFTARVAPLGEWLAQLVAGFAGSVSAEHGIGIDKKPYLHYTRSAAEIAAMRGIKRVLDPNAVMNPGKIFDIVPQD